MKDVPPTRIRFLAELRNGFPFASGTFTNEPLTPLIRIRDIKSTSFNTFVPRWAIPDEAIAKDGDIIIGMDGDFNSILWTRGEAAINQRVASLRPTKGTDSRFIAYAIPRKLKEINDITHSTTVKHISGEQILNIQVPHYDLPTQRRIADYLDRETAQIDAMAGALDGLVARLEERRSAVITRVTSGLPAEATDFDTFNSPTDGTPRAWTRTRFGHEFIESTERVGSQTPGPLLSISEYRGIEVNTRTDGQMPSLDVSNYRVVRPGQLAANMMWLNHGGIGVSNHLGYISPDYKSFFISPRVNTRFAHYLFRTRRYITYFETIGTGVRPNAKRVTKTALNATPLSRPPLDEQRRIADYLDAETAKIDAMIAKAGELRALLDERRSALITATVTGQHPVPKEP